MSCCQSSVRPLEVALSGGGPLVCWHAGSLGGTRRGATFESNCNAAPLDEPNCFGLASRLANLTGYVAITCASNRSAVW